MSLLVELPQSQYNPNAFGEFDADAGFRGNALPMAWMAQLAYETRLPDKMHIVAEAWGLDDLVILGKPAKSTLPLSDTRGLIARKGTATIIAFAGTDPANLLNWVSDFYLGRPNADAHEGFVDAAAAVWSEVEDAIQRTMNEGRPLFVSGHSLGAAIALATVDRAHMEKKLNAAQVFVFGSPRVGRADFVSRYNDAFGSTTYRLVYGRDIIPTVPPTELQFHHVGRFLHCQGGTKFEENEISTVVESDEPTVGLDFFSGIADRLRGLFGFGSTSLRTDPLGQLSQLLAPAIGDHLPDRYYNALTKKA
jgi:hypothetical protein